MRRTCILQLFPVCSARPAPAQAQVTVDLHALDALPGGKPATESSPQHQPPPKRASKRLTAARQRKPLPAQATAAARAPQSATPAATTAATPAAAPPATTVPNTAAPTPAPPAATACKHCPAGHCSRLRRLYHAAPSRPRPRPPHRRRRSPTAPPAPRPRPGHGLRREHSVPDEADLSPSSASAIHDFVQSAPSGDSASYNVVAYAAGTPEDPSTARRLSLSRALAVRSALMADGISSTHIYVRALGATAGDATPDRVDVAVLGGNTTPASATIQAPATTPTRTPANTKSQQQ